MIPVPVLQVQPLSAAQARLDLLPPRQPLPRTTRPFPDETAESYLDRLAQVNCLDGNDLRAYLAGDRRGLQAPLDIAALAVLAGLPEIALRRAMPELSSPGELAAFPWIAGRARPHAAVSGLACRRCAAGRGVQPIYRWQTHENVICLRHQLWTHVPYRGPDAQLDLREHPEIWAANRQHRRLIRHFGRPAVHFAFVQARRICAEWYKDRGTRMYVRGLEKRLDALACTQHLMPGDPAEDAALYPNAVTLTRLLASPGWAGQILGEHSSEQVGLDDLDLNLIDAEIDRLHPGAKSQMHWRDYQIQREAVLLAAMPGTLRFAREVRRTVAPDYVWLPVSYYNKCEPLAEWVRDRAKARESAYQNYRHTPPPSEVYGAEHLMVPADEETVGVSSWHARLDPADEETVGVCNWHARLAHIQRSCRQAS
jgi:hypothetical protein